MGLYGFKKQFAEHILSGRKRHTIRAPRKHSDKPGNKVHLYTGLRQKGAKLLMVGICTKIEDISLIVDEEAQTQVYVNGDRLAPDEREALAKADGFDGWREMAQFWNGLYPFHGQIIHWKPLETK